MNSVNLPVNFFFKFEYATMKFFPVDLSQNKKVDIAFFPFLVIRGGAINKGDTNIVREICYFFKIWTKCFGFVYEVLQFFINGTAEG